MKFQRDARAICMGVVASAATASALLATTNPAIAQTGLSISESSYSVEETLSRLEETIASKELTLFGIVDHAAGAASVGLELPPMQVVIFGNPAAGTPLMQCGATMGIDLPMKFLIWEDEGQTLLAYNEMEFLQERHQLEGCDEEIAKISGALEAIVTEVTQP